MSLLVVGSIAYDTVETPFGKAEDVLGGSASYFSVSASRFARPRVVAVVGADFRAEDRALLAYHGADLTGLHQAEGKTFRWGGRYEADGINRVSLFTELNVFEDFDPRIPAEHEDSEIVFLGNIHPRLQARVLDQVKRPALVAADTMDLWINTQRPALLELLKRVNVLFVNDAEATALTGERVMRRAADALRAMGPETIVIKRGEHGALLFSGETVFLAPALPLRQVLDPTGAGDTFAGGFVGYLAAGGPITPERLRQAMAVGTVMASFCVEAFSLDRLRTATPTDVRDRLALLAEMTRFEMPDVG